MLKIKNVEKSSLVDYPPYICATIFLQGCNFRCPFCYNGSLVNEDDNSMPNIPESELLLWLETRIGKLDAVCITGGEPTIHGHELTSLIHPIKSIGYKIKLDTNGTNPNLLRFLIKNSMIDYIAMDIKGPLETYGSYIGIPGYDTSDIEASIDIIRKSPIPYEFRMTTVPGLHKESDIQRAAWQSDKDKFIIQNFKPINTLDPRYEKIAPFSDNELKKISYNLGIQSR